MVNELNAAKKLIVKNLELRIGILIRIPRLTYSFSIDSPA